MKLEELIFFSLEDILQKCQNIFLIRFKLTLFLLKIIDLAIGLRVADEEEIQGLDINQHNERGYDN